MMWGWSWWMIFGGILMIIFWIGVIWLVVWGIRKIARGSEGKSSGTRSALDIARERYARGEITKEQFEQYKKDLS
jgi:putative membrane protein